MKKTMLKLPLSVMAAGAIIFSSFALTGSALSDDESALLHVGDLNTNVVRTELVTAPENAGVEDIGKRLGASNANNADSEFLSRCAGSRWGYSTLDSDGKRDYYNELYDACERLWNSNENLSDDLYYIAEYKDNGLTLADAVDVFMSFELDNPQFYFIPGGYGYASDSRGTHLVIFVLDEYRSASARKTAQNNIKNFVTTVGDAAVSSSKSAYQRALYIHDKIVKEFDYGQSSSNPDRAYNIAGALADKICVCEGYTEMFSVICHYAGLDAIYVSGIGVTDIDSGPHGWNMVKLDDGKYYYFDVTWDDNIGRTKYFANGSSTFSRSHIPNSSAEYHGTEYFLYDLPKGSETDFNTANIHSTHSFGSWKETVAATCTEPGKKEHVCTVCGAKETQTIDPLGHSFRKTVTEPNYEHGGYTTYACTRCRYGYVGDRTDPLPKITVSAKTDDGCALLSWTAIKGAEKYAVAGYVSGKWQKIAETTGTSYLLRGLKNGTKYTVGIIPMTNGNWRTDLIVSTPVTPSPRYPVVKSEVSGRQFRLSWSRVANAEKYGIAYYKSGKWNMIVTTSPGVSTYTSAKLDSGTYTIAVCAKVNGEWDTSNINSRAVKIVLK